MKTKVWILLLAILALACSVLSLWLFWPREADSVKIWSEGKLLRTVSLAQDTTFTVETPAGTNVITVQDGKVAVTEANCPDRYCVARGFCSGGAQIVCLPHRLVLEFVTGGAVDSVAG